MKVVLLQDIKGIGKKHDIVEVADGYARNFLIAKKLAVPADTAGLALKAQKDKEVNETKKKYENFTRQLENEIFEFAVKAGEKGEVFGSVNKKDIEATLERKGYTDASVRLGKPLKSLGEHIIEISFPYGYAGKIKISIKAKS